MNYYYYDSKNFKVLIIIDGRFDDHISFFNFF